MQSEINNRGVSCNENNIRCYNTNEHQHRGRIEMENYISFFFRLTSCWDSEPLILLVMLGSKQLQWINKITHLDMPVNLIILEQGEELGNRTKAIRLTEAKTQAARVAEHNSSLKIIFLLVPVSYYRFCSWGETVIFRVLRRQKLSLFIDGKHALYQILFSVRY